jgi:transposase
MPPRSPSGRRHWGHKNWIHFGSQEAGLRIAVVLSIVETYRRLKIPIRHYPASILPGLAELH